MSDKIIVTVDDWKAGSDAIRSLTRERDELRAEVERLVMQHENLSRECLGQYELMSAEVERLQAKVDDLTNAATTAKNLLSRKQPHSVADVDGDAWEAWAVLEAALVNDKEC